MCTTRCNGRSKMQPNQNIKVVCYKKNIFYCFSFKFEIYLKLNKIKHSGSQLHLPHFDCSVNRMWPAATALYSTGKETASVKGQSEQNTLVPPCVPFSVGINFKQERKLFVQCLVQLPVSSQFSLCSSLLLHSTSFPTPNAWSSELNNNNNKIYLYMCIVLPSYYLFHCTVNLGIWVSGYGSWQFVIQKERPDVTQVQLDI